jgi:mono/diheme cytochrome c family protein
MRGALIGIVVLFAIGLAASAASGQTNPPGAGGIDESLAGSVSFDVYCATCHGRSGHGDGPAAKALRTTPADLTVLGRRNNGVFPEARVAASVVDSSRSAAHGSQDMPVWGPLFRTLDGADERESTRLRNLLSFLASIQLPSGSLTALPGPDPDGASLYRDHCSSCHGASARGGGPLTFALRSPAPNLRTLSARNGGVFPREATVRVIEGVGLPSHGARDMPVWGQLLRRRRPRDPGAGTSIDALMSYLEQIQDQPRP